MKVLEKVSFYPQHDRVPVNSAYPDIISPSEINDKVLTSDRVYHHLTLHMINILVGQ